MYSHAQAAQLCRQMKEYSVRLQALQLAFVRETESVTSSKAKEHLTHGAGRRVAVMRRAIMQIFRCFPPDTKAVLSRDALTDVQINFHALTINVAGFFDNCVWAIVYHRDAKALIAKPLDVGLFNKKSQSIIPAAIREYLGNVNKEGWFDSYLKDYRDALAHRIPMYLPPSQVASENVQRVKDLGALKIDSIRKMDFAGLNQANAEDAALQSPCFFILHSHSEAEPARPICLHPQVLTDALTVLDFSEVFLSHWRDEN